MANDIQGPLPRPTIKLERGNYSRGILAYHGALDRHYHAHRDAASGWAGRHMSAYRVHPVGKMIDSLALYADRHWKQWNNGDGTGGIGDDGFLGPEWATMLVACRVLLNGDLGQMDDGTLDADILAMLGAEGFLDANGEPKID